MNWARFAEGQDLFKEGDPADSVFRLLSGAVDILRDLDGDPILLGRIGAGRRTDGRCGKPPPCDFSRRQRGRGRILTPNEFFDQITGSPRGDKAPLRAGENEVIARRREFAICLLRLRSFIQGWLAWGYVSGSLSRNDVRPVAAWDCVNRPMPRRLNDIRAVVWGYVSGSSIARLLLEKMESIPLMQFHYWHCE